MSIENRTTAFSAAPMDMRARIDSHVRALPFLQSWVVDRVEPSEDTCLEQMRAALLNLSPHPDCHAWTLARRGPDPEFPPEDAPEHEMHTVREQSILVLQVSLQVLLLKHTLQGSTMTLLVEYLLSNAWVPNAWVPHVLMWHQGIVTQSHHHVEPLGASHLHLEHIAAPFELARTMLEDMRRREEHLLNTVEYAEAVLDGMVGVAQWVRIPEAGDFEDPNKAQEWDEWRLRHGVLPTGWPFHHQRSWVNKVKSATLWGWTLSQRVLSNTPLYVYGTHWELSIGMWSLLAMVHDLSLRPGLSPRLVDLLRSKVKVMLQDIPVFPYLLPSRRRFADADRIIADLIIADPHLRDTLGHKWVSRLCIMERVDIPRWLPRGAIVPVCPHADNQPSTWRQGVSDSLVVGRLQGHVTTALQQWLFPEQTGPVTSLGFMVQYLPILLVGKWVPRRWGPALLHWWQQTWESRPPYIRLDLPPFDADEGEDGRGALFTPCELAMLLLRGAPRPPARVRGRAAADAYAEQVLQHLVTYFADTVRMNGFEAAAWQPLVDVRAFDAFRQGWIVCTRVLQQHHQATAADMPSRAQWRTSALGLWCLLKHCMVQVCSGAYPRSKNAQDKLVMDLMGSVPACGDTRDIVPTRSKLCLPDFAEVIPRWIQWKTEDTSAPYTYRYQSPLRSILCQVPYGFPLVFAALHPQLLFAALHPQLQVATREWYMLTMSQRRGRAYDQLIAAIRDFPHHHAHDLWVRVQQHAYPSDVVRFQDRIAHDLAPRFRPDEDTVVFGNAGG